MVKIILKLIFRFRIKFISVLNIKGNLQLMKIDKVQRYRVHYYIGFPV